MWIGGLSLLFGMFALAFFEGWPAKLRLIGFVGAGLVLAFFAFGVAFVYSFSNCG